MNSNSLIQDQQPYVAEKEENSEKLQIVASSSAVVNREKHNENHVIITPLISQNNCLIKKSPNESDELMTSSQLNLASSENYDLTRFQASSNNVREQLHLFQNSPKKVIIKAWKSPFSSFY